MGEQLQIPIPMWRVQFQLLGGYRRMIGVLVISLTVIVIAFGGMRRVLPNESFASLVDWAVRFLGPIQGIILVFGGCNAIYRAMLRDHDTRMIESHRLTPMSNLAVVLGYVFGATLQVLPLWLLVFTVGCVLIGAAGAVGLDAWIAGNLCLLNGAITVWAAAVFLGMRPGKPFNPSGAVVGVAMLTVPISLLPGAGMLFNVYPILLGVGMMRGSFSASTDAIIMVVCISLGFTFFWILAGAVKYRRPDLPALNGARGMLLLLVTIVISTVGIAAFDRTAMAFLPGPGSPAGGAPAQWIATMIGGLLLAAVPIAGAVRCRMLSVRGTVLRGWGDRLNPVVVALLAALFVCGIMALLGLTVWRDIFERFDDDLASAMVGKAWLFSTAAVTVGALSLMYVFQIGYRLMKSPKVILVMFIVFAWAMPPLADLARATYVASEFGQSAAYSQLMSYSAPGTIIAAWTGEWFNLLPGWLVQVGICVGLGLLAHRLRVRPIPQAVEPRPAPPASS